MRIITDSPPRILLQFTLLISGCIAAYNGQRDELHNADSALNIDPHAGHTHGDQMPLEYVKYPWQSPETFVYPGDNDGMPFF
jgi:hypothetical protein